MLLSISGMGCQRENADVHNTRPVQRFDTPCRQLSHLLRVVVIQTSDINPDHSSVIKSRNNRQVSRYDPRRSKHRYRSNFPILPFLSLALSNPILPFRLDRGHLRRVSDCNSRTRDWPANGFERVSARRQPATDEQLLVGDERILTRNL